MAGTAERQNAALDAFVECLRADARSLAAELRALAELSAAASQEEREQGLRQFPMMELAGSARLGAAASSSRLAEADRVVTTLPLTLELLAAGDLLVHQARVVVAETASCDPQVARRAEAAVLPQGLGLCPADLRKQLRRAVLRTESELSVERQQELAEQRLADARAQRRTWTSAEPHGMGVASALMTAEQLRRWQLDLDQLERAEQIADRQAGVQRTADQRRADLFAALPGMVLEGRRAFAAAGEADTGQSSGTDGVPACRGFGPGFGPGASAGPPARTILNVLVPVATILTRSAEPGSIAGVGPISAEHVRLLRPAGFRRILVEHDTGRPLHVEDRIMPADPDPHAARRQVLDMMRPALVTDVAEPQHDPSARLARLIDLRDLRCAGPGCSSTCNHRDHLDPWPAGPTAAWNLGPLSSRCHQAKHSGWTLVRHPDGSVTWTSPLGRTYDRPPPHPRPPKSTPTSSSHRCGHHRPRPRRGGASCRG